MIARRPYLFLRWAKETFGGIALDPRERATRVLEEALELAHAEGVPTSVALRLVERTFARPRSPITALEIAQVAVTLEAAACNLGLDVDTLADAEYLRVTGIDPEEWRRRHLAKVNLGVAR